MSKVVLFGCGHSADIAFRFLSRDTDHEIVGFTVDRVHMDQDEYNGRPVVPFEEVATHFPPDRHKMLVFMGYQDMNGLRERKYLEGKKKGYGFISYVCSNIFRIDEINVGENCFIMDNQSISLDVEIKNNVVMWSSNHIGDRSIIEDNVWIASHVTVAGESSIGQSSFVGVSATIGNFVNVAARTFIGANAFIASDTDEDCVYLAGQSAVASDNSRTFMRVMEASRKL